MQNAKITHVEYEEVLSEKSTYKRYLKFEIALAEVQSEIGIIPLAAAVAIAEYSTIGRLDLERLQIDAESIGFPIVGLVRQITEIVPDELGQYAHWGATTQDVMDTGLVLALRDVLLIFESSLVQLVQNFRSLAQEHRKTLMSGRSQLQQAVPITMGYKIAGWVWALQRHQERFSELKPRLLQVQFGGAVGTMAAVHPHGPAIRAKLAKRLGLLDPLYCWHTHRDSLGELVSLLGLLTATLSKMATDIVLMAQTEVAEVHEPNHNGRGISSTMPQKRNPILSQRIMVSARFVRGMVPTMFEAMVQDHERGTGTWQTEWSLVPNACNQALSALNDMVELSTGLIIDPERMETNLGLSAQLVYSEAVMMALANSLGRQVAHDLVGLAVDRAIDGVSFKQALWSFSEVRKLLTEEDLNEIFDGIIHRAAGAASVDAILGLDNS